MSQPAPSHPAPLLFPVGHYHGPSYPRGSARPRYHLIRIGRLVGTLREEAKVAVWLAAHRPPQESARPWNRQETAETVRRDWPEIDPDPVIDELIESGLLVEVGPDPRDAVGFAKSHRLIPLVMGLGNQPDDSMAYGLGLPGAKPLVEVSLSTFDIYSWCGAKRSLWAVCEAFARSSMNSGLRDEAEVDPERALLEFLAPLQTLLSWHTACLDEACPW